MVVLESTFTPSKRKAPVMARLWQLRILKTLFDQTVCPNALQKHLVSIRTGLSERWIKCWFARQRKLHSLAGPRGRPVVSENIDSSTLSAVKVYEWHPPMLCASDAAPQPSVPASSSQSGCLSTIFPRQTENDFSSSIHEDEVSLCHGQALVTHTLPQLQFKHHGSSTGPVNSLGQFPIMQYFQESQEYVSSQISERPFNMLSAYGDLSSSGTSTEIQAYTPCSCLDVPDFFSPSFPTNAFPEFGLTPQQPTIPARDTPPIVPILGHGRIAAGESSPLRQWSQAERNSPVGETPDLEPLHPTPQPCYSNFLQTKPNFPQPGLATGLASIMSTEPLQSLPGNQLLASQSVSAQDGDQPSPVFFTIRLEDLKVMMESAWSPIFEVLEFAEIFSQKNDEKMSSSTNEIPPQTGALDSEMKKVVPDSMGIQKSISSDPRRWTLLGHEDKEKSAMNHRQELPTLARITETTARPASAPDSGLLGVLK